MKIARKEAMKVWKMLAAWDIAVKLFTGSQRTRPFKAPITNPVRMHWTRIASANLLPLFCIPFFHRCLLVCPQNIKNLLEALIKYAVGFTTSGLKIQFVYPPNEGRCENA